MAVKVTNPGASGQMRLAIIGGCPSNTRCKDCRDFRTCCSPKQMTAIIKNGK